MGKKDVDIEKLFDDPDKSSDESKSEKKIKIVWEKRDDIKPIVQSLIEQFPEQLSHIQPSRISYVGFSKKKSKVLAHVRPIRGEYELFMQSDYFLAVYLENWVQRTPAEKRVLILHELLHIPDGGFDSKHKNHKKCLDHDIKDFSFVLQRFGIYWEKSEEILKDMKKDVENKQEAKTTVN